MGATARAGLVGGDADVPEGALEVRSTPAEVASDCDVAAGLDHLWSPAEFEALEQVLRPRE